eukprot:gnl/TRDRNA2_/TRDRNA2_203478_c0_seq1.p1 gnl/TRDRNA2_/TRDRNA2_203478_c0~~gnl/TRDRNA2_/TRDRNA2_203478_c0_seq1.p1  ORF type:complete len:379 (+),score=45.78 gnl/TRDRNA2_/TRDRNA2_203478_c0_seq1:53-1189(+)
MASLAAYICVHCLLLMSIFSVQVASSSEMQTVRIGFGSCIHHDRQPWTVFDDIQKLGKLDRFVFLGDLIYADWNDTSSMEGENISSLSGAELAPLLNTFYQRAFADEHFSRFIQQNVVDFMWDDHEIFDNYDLGPFTEAYRTSRHLFDQYVAWRNPSPRVSGELYYSDGLLAAGVSLFVLDARSHRSPLHSPGGSSKTMVGRSQLSELKAWLLQTPGDTFKIICSPVMWNDQAGFQRFLDGWAYYKDERDDIFEFITANAIRNVVLISGDAHVSGVFYFKGHDIWEVSVSPLASPALPTFQEPANASLDSTAVFVQGDVEGLVGVIEANSTAMVVQVIHITNDRRSSTLFSLTLPRKFGVTESEPSRQNIEPIFEAKL